MTRIIITTAAIAIIGSAGMALSAPLQTRVVEGADEGPLIRIIVAREDRGKVVGLDRQLAGFQLEKGRLVIETHASSAKIEPGDLDGAMPDLEIRVNWMRVLPDGRGADGARPGNQLPHLSATEPAKVAALVRRATKGSVADGHLEAMTVAEMAAEGTAAVEMDFLTPRSGAPRSRQFRIVRRFAANLLEDLGMMRPFSGFYPPGLDATTLICNYDAEGCGYHGTTLTERVVDETTLDFMVIPVCGEDIRDGALAGARAVMFPGGSGRGIANALRPEGVEMVRTFVREGGGFVGICAGAFLAGSGLEEYARLHHLTHHQPWAKGRATLRLELTPEGVEIMGPEFQSIETNYNNGPVFTEITPPPPDARHGPLVVLSTFATVPPPRRGESFDEPMSGSPAILAFRYGQGRVLTISPHPEGRRALNAMVARCIGWTIHVERDSIHARSEAGAPGDEDAPAPSGDTSND